MFVDGLDDRVETLSAQELEVLRLVGKAMSIKEVAALLPRRLETVKGQLSSARAKLGVASSREAARLVLAWDLSGSSPKRGAPKKSGDADAAAPTFLWHGSSHALEPEQTPPAAHNLGGAGAGAVDARPSSTRLVDRLAPAADHRGAGALSAPGSFLGRDPYSGLDFRRRGTADKFAAGGRHDLALLHRTFIVFAIAALSVLSVAGMAAGSILLMHVFEHLKRGVPVIS